MAYTPGVLGGAGARPQKKTIRASFSWIGWLRGPEQSTEVSQPKLTTLPLWQMKLLRHPGIEPGSPRWQRGITPLYKKGSFRLRAVWQRKLVRSPGIELHMSGFPQPVEHPLNLGSTFCDTFAKHQINNQYLLVSDSRGLFPHYNDSTAEPSCWPHFMVSS